MFRVFSQRLGQGFLYGKIFLIGEFHTETEARLAAVRGNSKAFTPFYYWVEKKGG